MEEVKVFLLDLNVGSRLGGTLRGILESSVKPPIRLLERSLTLSESSLSGHELSKTVSHFNPHLIFLILPSYDPKQISGLIQSLAGKPSELPIMVIMEGDKPEDMIELLKLGVVDFIMPPLRKMDVLPRLWRVLEQKTPDEALSSHLKKRIGLKQMLGEDPVFLAEINKIPLVANCDASVLILGETGTGKELCARAIHYLSPRSGKPFIPVNCGSIPTELVENELFGHVKGAFTGALESYTGLIHEAHSGTLFLDEIDCLPLQAQVKLLRFLQDREYRQLGSAKTHQANVRIIVASNVDLERMVSEGKFRQDLFYRLNIIPLRLPPLHDRQADIPLLARHFLRKYASEFRRPAKDFTPEALEKLLIYEWPGNIRELENVVQRAVVFCQHEIIQGAHIDLPRVESTAPQESLQAMKSRVVAEFEKKYIQGLLLVHQGNISRAAKAAQKNRRAFWELMRKYKIQRPSLNAVPQETG